MPRYQFSESQLNSLADSLIARDRIPPRADDAANLLILRLKKFFPMQLANRRPHGWSPPKASVVRAAMRSEQSSLRKSISTRVARI
ncbi:MAG: hypothetical protein R3C56_06860 [Pirellulaceae bacterium]